MHRENLLTIEKGWHFRVSLFLIYSETFYSQALFPNCFMTLYILEDYTEQSPHFPYLSSDIFPSRYALSWYKTYLYPATIPADNITAAAAILSCFFIEKPPINYYIGYLRRNYISSRALIPI